jgi:hypothetical protein
MVVRLLVVVMMIFVSAVSGYAQQEKPKYEVTGGYSYTGFESQNMNGWFGSFAGTVNPWLGLAGDLSGHYASQSASGGGFSVSADTSLYSYRFGPRISKPVGQRMTPFAQMLFGGATLRTSGSTTTGSETFDVTQSVNGFAMGLGGGLDIDASERIGIRLLQAEYSMLRVQSQNLNGVRLSFGLIYRLQ